MNWDNIFFVNLVLDFGEQVSINELFEIFPNKDFPKILEAAKKRKAFEFQTLEVNAIEHFWFTSDDNKDVLVVIVKGFDEEIGIKVSLADSTVSHTSFTKPEKIKKSTGDVSSFVEEFESILKTPAI